MNYVWSKFFIPLLGAGDYSRPEAFFVADDKKLIKGLFSFLTTDLKRAENVLVFRSYYGNLGYDWSKDMINFLRVKS